MNLLTRLYRLTFGRLDVRTFGIIRSEKWGYVRNKFLKENPSCAVCGTYGDLDVHHCLPVHVDFRQELNPDNLITLCRPHHFTFGHLDNWSSYNTEVRNDADTFINKISHRP